MTPILDPPDTATQFSGSPARALDNLIALPERELQSRIIEPLLRELGFENVIATAGPNERGKDIVATLSGALGGYELWSIQIKKLESNARIRSNQFTATLDQLRQALEEPVRDPLTGELRTPDRCYLITPYPLPQNVRDAFGERIKTFRRDGCAVIDGGRLIDLIRTKASFLLAELVPDGHYRDRLTQQVGFVHEAAVAFELTRPLPLTSILVDVDFERLAMSRTLRKLMRYSRVGPVKSADAAALGRLYKRWYDASPRDLVTRLVQKDLRILEGEALAVADLGRDEEFAFLDIRPFIARLTADAHSCERMISAAEKAGNSSDHWNAIIPDVARTSGRVFEFLRSNVILGLGTTPARPPRGKAGSLTSSHLIGIRHNVLILAGGGSGKTTLLRRIALERAKDERSPLPVFIPLVALDKSTTADLLRLIQQHLVHHGFSRGTRTPSQQGVMEALEQGELCLLLDGLDETGSRAPEVLAAIDKLADAYPRVQIILSSRDPSRSLYWPKAFVVELRPFADPQLRLFIQKWFAAEPSKSVGLRRWLARNRRMRESARTPLIAALLCSLHDLDADLPTTEHELYNKRLELLLGRWEQAKGLTPLPVATRRRIRHFLMDVAFALHKAQRRFEDAQTVVYLGRRYYDRRRHGSAEGLVEDCIARGVLERSGKRISFGHLTYQEFLAGDWLATHGDHEFLWSALSDPWWEQALSFYAAQKGDVSGFLRYGLTKRRSILRRDSFVRIVGAAVMTPESLVLKALNRLSIPISKAGA